MCHLCLCSTQHAPKMNSWSFPHKGGPIPALWNQETLSGTLYHCTKHHVLGFICLSPMPGSLSWSQPKSLSFYFLDYFFFFLDYWYVFLLVFPSFPVAFLSAISYIVIIFERRIQVCISTSCLKILEWFSLIIQIQKS